MNSNNNGKAIVYNNVKLNRKVLFSGLEHGYNTYPTDIDMILNLRNEINIIVDAKEIGKQPVFGQTITYVNITDALQKAGVPSYIAWIEHPSNVDVIVAAECKVVKIYHDSTWITRDKICQVFGCDITYKELQEQLMKRHNVEPYDPAKHKFNKNKYLG
jgi:hypothetical protein